MREQVKKTPKVQFSKNEPITELKTSVMWAANGGRRQEMTAFRLSAALLAQL